MRRTTIGKREDGAALVAGNAIWARGLVKSYGAVRALGGLDLSVPRGVICGLLGPNGSGKTTAIRILLGLARPDAGAAQVLGLDAGRDSLAIRGRTGYLAQDPSFYGHMTARQVLRFVAGLYLRGPAAGLEGRVAEMLELVDLQERADRPVAGFSGGERQRLGIAQAALSRPQLLILDEPASALDPMGRHRVLEIMQRLRGSTTIFYSTHILDDVQRVSDMVVIMREGVAISEGPIAALLDGGSTYQVAARHPGGVGALVGLRQTLEHQEWVVRVSGAAEQGSLQLEVDVSDTDRADAGLLRLLLQDRELVVDSFGRRRYELEQAFIELMQGGAEADG